MAFNKNITLNLPDKNITCDCGNVINTKNMEIEDFFINNKEFGFFCSCGKFFKASLFFKEEEIGDIILKGVARICDM